ncbi:unnamed protein product, partial [Notodromas monacha]
MPKCVTISVDRTKFVMEVIKEALAFDSQERSSRKQWGFTVAHFMFGCQSVYPEEVLDSVAKKSPSMLQMRRTISPTEEPMDEDRMSPGIRKEPEESISSDEPRIKQEIDDASWGIDVTAEEVVELTRRTAKDKIQAVGVYIFD